MLANSLALLSSELESAWRQTPLLYRLALAGVAVVAVTLVVFFANMARTPDYAVAFANLREEEAGAIVSRLKENKIPYELSERGTIRVPSSQVEEVRLLVAAQGVTGKGGAGFDFFSQPHFGLTEFAEKVNYQHALEAEISRTISRMEAIESARVHLVIPQPTLFTSAQKEATASIVIRVKPGRRLDPTQIVGITGLVAGSVEGLKPQNVSVLDTSGNVLTDRQLPGDGVQQTDRRSAVQRALETRIEEDVRLMLQRVLGPDKAIVRVGAELDWDQYETSTETYSPPNKPPQLRTQRESTETSQGVGPAGGIPGALSNVPGAGGQADSRGQAQSERREVSSTYEVSKTVERLIRAPGGIKRLSVAVALDSDTVAGVEQVDVMTRLVATAAGLDVNRGDVVTLTTLPFSPAVGAESGELAGSARQAEFALSLARILAMLIGPLIVLGIILVIMKRPAASFSVRAPQVSPALTAPVIEALPRPRSEDLSAARLQKELGAFAQSDPATVAQIVRGWMVEERGAR